MEVYIVLDTLENRVKNLESKILGKIALDDINISKVKPVSSTLHEIDTVLISTLSGREKITSLLKKVDILEKILDPSYMETNCNLDSKIEAVLETESDFIFYHQGLQRLEELKSILNSDTAENSLNLSDRLNKLTINLLKCKEECDKQSLEVKQLVTDYKESIFQLTKLFAELEAVTTKLETESKIKKKE